MDFKNQSTDWGLYSFYDNLSFFNLAAGAGGSVPPDSYVQVVLTRSFTDEVTGYVNGNRDMVFADPAGEAFLGDEDILSFFRDDLQYPDENAAGTVARLRIYFGDLSPAEVAALDRLPGVTHRQKPSLTSASNAEGAVSLPFRFQIRAANGPDSFSATGLPEWASLNHTTGEITGTPPTVGLHLIGVSACNAAGCDAQTLTLNITDFTLSAEPGANPLHLIIEGPTGNRYSVEHAEAVPPSTEWSVLTNFTATETRSIILDPSATNAPQRFYRALRLP
jgi:hypothetical protein